MLKHAMHKYVAAIAVCLAAAHAELAPAWAFEYNWTGDASDSNWFTDFNWLTGEIGIGPPVDGDTAIISNGDQVFISRDFLPSEFIDDLTVSGGSKLENRASSGSSAGYLAVVEDGSSGLTLLSGSNSELVVWDHIAGTSLAGFDTDRMTIESNATLSLANGRVEINYGLINQSSGTIRGRGWIDLEYTDAVSSPVEVFRNNGTLHVYDYDSSGSLPVMRITTTDPHAYINLDGTSQNGVVDIEEGGLLYIDAPLGDGFSGTITMATNSELEIVPAWTNTGGANVGVINVNAGGSTATISGGDFTNNGTINVNSGTLVLESNYQDDGASINANGTAVRTEADADFNSPSFSGAYELTVGGGSDTTINAGTFNWDGNGNAITTIEENGSLTINATTLDTDDTTYDGELIIAGDLIVNLPDPAFVWTLANTDDTVMISPGATINGSSTLANAADHTIRGQGVISIDMINQGDVIAENGELRLLENTVTNGGTVTIAANGSLFMSTNSLLTGGTLHGVDGAVIDGSGTGTIQNIIVTGTIKQAIGTTRLAGTITNNGVITYIDSPLNSNEILRVDTTATLTGSGELVMNSVDAFLSGTGMLTNDAGHTIRGSGEISVEFTNSGILRPEGLITLTGDYEQTTTGVLEIPVRGLTPNTQHGQLSVSGTAFLDGGLRVLFESGFVPQEDDEVQFLAAAAVAGDFLSRSFPDLATVAPPLAVEMLRDMGGNLTGRLRFVVPTSNPLGMNIPNPDNPNFMNPANYDEGAPQSSHNVVLRNLTGATRTIIAQEDAMFDNSANPFVHTLTIGGVGSVAPLIFEHRASSTISATAGVTVDALGVYDFQGGSLFTSKLEVLGGGTLSGSGQIAADVLVGTAGGGDVALFDPGGVGIGAVSIDGQYQQGLVGRLAIDITGPSGGANHDKITVSDDVTLAGRITFFVDELSAGEFVPGAAYDIMETFGSVTGEFERIDVSGRDDIYFSIDYGVSPAAGSGSESLLNSRITATGWWRGDGNQDTMIDVQDAMVLAAVLVHGNPSSVPYGENLENLAVANFLDAYDFVDTTPDDTRVVDFYDVPFFAQAMAESQGTSLAAAYGAIDRAIAAAYSWGSVPEPASGLLMLWGAAWWLTASRRK